MLGLYIHIPFCIKKCNYCDFNSYKLNEEQKDKYLKYIKKEMNLYKSIYKDKIFTSIFIGGGTPSILSEDEIKILMKDVYTNFNIDENAEISMECNPGTLNKEKLIAMKESGINRISIGLQAIQKHHLNKLGRIHSFEEFVQNYKTAKEVGFENINIDLMYAIPNQSIDEWKETLKEIVKLNPTHISAYSLILEEGTKFFEMYENEEIELADEDDDINMYEYTINYLAQNGYSQYEISNYAKDSYQCEHNKVYWRCEKYLGLGLGAAGYIDDSRYSNIEEFEEYYKMLDQYKLPINEKNTLSNEDKIEEKIFMGLRMNEGINLTDFEEEFNINFEQTYKNEIEKLKNQKLILIDNKNIKLTQKGRELSNSVFIEFMK